tara:strand:+ start:370 stop:522 length:153 start_codon:yes stop_codon:yes gene_type:complete
MKNLMSVYRINEITAIIMDEIGRDVAIDSTESGKMFVKIRRAIDKIVNSD